LLPTIASPTAQLTPPQEPRAVYFIATQAISAWRTHPVAYLLAQSTLSGRSCSGQAGTGANAEV